MNLNALWMHLFGSTDLLGINFGFWAAMSIVLFIAILMNVAFWTIALKKISTKKHRTSFVRCFFYLIPAACAHRHRFRHYCPALLP